MAQQSAGMPYIGSLISLISKTGVRYEGTLYTIDMVESTIALQNGAHVLSRLARPCKVIEESPSDLQLVCLQCARLVPKDGSRTARRYLQVNGPLSSSSSEVQFVLPSTLTTLGKSDRDYLCHLDLTELTMPRLIFRLGHSRSNCHHQRATWWSDGNSTDPPSSEACSHLSEHFNWLCPICRHLQLHLHSTRTSRYNAVRPILLLLSTFLNISCCTSFQAQVLQLMQLRLMQCALRRPHSHTLQPPSLAQTPRVHIATHKVSASIAWLNN